MRMSDKYEEVPNWREIYGKLDRPEYILKNGKAINCYGLLKDINEMQVSHDQLTDENARLREALNEIIRLVRHPLTMDVMDISNTTEMNNAIRILNKDTK